MEMGKKTYKRSGIAGLAILTGALFVIAGCSTSNREYYQKPIIRETTEGSPAEKGEMEAGGISDGDMLTGETADDTSKPRTMASRYSIDYNASDDTMFEQFLAAVISEEMLEQAQEVVGHEGGSTSTRYMVTTEDGVTHTWFFSGNALLYINDRGGSDSDEESAASQADEILQKMDIPVVPETSSAEMIRFLENGLVQYRILLNETPYVGLVSLGTVLAETEESENLTGAYIAMRFKDSGICSANIYCPPTIMEDLGEVKLIGMEMAVEQAKVYLQASIDKWVERNNLPWEIDMVDGLLSYMPYTENGKLILIPVYELDIHSNRNGKERYDKVLVDGETGYVHYQEFFYPSNEIIVKEEP